LGVFRATPIPEIQNSEIRDTFCAFQDSGLEINPEKTLFSQKPLCAAVQGISKFEISGISEISGTFTQLSKNFRKISEKPSG
jgi:hypothetical protein